ncbi:MAG: Cupredoxin-like domain, partial [Thermomicrobiales bacterium]|nr:Cupredoxin-like domain [Thermomicrobiales bacterium]
MYPVRAIVRQKRAIRKWRRVVSMLKRIGLFTVVGLLAMVVLAACGGEEETVEPTVTRIPATNAPVVAPTEGGTTAAASPAASGSPAASPAASSAGSPEASVAASPAASPVASPAVSGDAGAATTTALTVELHDIFFDPKEITIPANTDVTITLVNKGAAPHTFDVDALNVHSGEVAPGATA